MTIYHHKPIHKHKPAHHHHYGCISDTRDQRDHKFKAKVVHLQNLPPSVDLRTHCPSVYDQGQLGSCTANSIAAAIEFDRMKQSLPDFIPSRLFIYYNERAMEGTVSSDSGAQIRDGIKSVNGQGACTEQEWPYDISQFTAQPTALCYQHALLDKALTYQRVSQDLNQMKGCLAEGYPIIVGISVYESFESQEVASSGIVPLPDQDEQVLGGHAVLVVGYDDASQRFLVRNSWGTGWGLRDGNGNGTGYFTIPYEYLTDEDLASDFWMIQVVGQ